MEGLIGPLLVLNPAKSLRNRTDVNMPRIKHPQRLIIPKQCYRFNSREAFDSIDKIILRERNGQIEYARYVT